ncbi:hypothetical protein [Streptomyces sp. NBC_01244]|uniref:hypothetical protein n=1 Tax=Streptomyces sp. NBC_01244 TaxID=2903797 RepID=UPI002E164C53|nr:hypothetical protein OG247_43875 [Streptomyces sp. NBC_01244]
MTHQQPTTAPSPVTGHYYSSAEVAAGIRRFLYAEAYMVTPPPGTASGRQTWRGTTMRAAVASSMRKPPVGWPHGQVEFHPGGIIRFTGPPPMPWDPSETWHAEPVAAPASWGPNCARCGAFEAEHCSWCAPWLHRPDGTSCVHGTFTPAS